MQKPGSLCQVQQILIHNNHHKIINPLPLQEFDAAEYWWHFALCRPGNFIQLIKFAITWICDVMSLCRWRRRTTATTHLPSPGCNFHRPLVRNNPIKTGLIIQSRWQWWPTWLDELGQQQRQFEDKVQINFLKFSVQILIFSSWRIAKGRGVTRTGGDAVSASEPASKQGASLVVSSVYLV